MPETILEAKDLVKKYGDFQAVKGISFDMTEGEVFGLLGPNGAGKSTTISMLTCLFPPSEGSIKIFGHDAQREPEAIKRLIGVVPQDLALYPTLSARDNLIFFGEMFGLSGKKLRERVEAVLDYVAMRERAGDAVKTYSGGMKRRINLAVGLINSPKILFLDEPTVGVDPQSRNHIFESVERLNREEGLAIVYTTHYMEEAERLCNRIAIVDHGQIIALDTPKALIDMLGGGIIKIGLARADDALRLAADELEEVKNAVYIPAAADSPPPARATLKVEAKNDSGAALIEIIRLFNSRKVEILSIETLEPNLESVFLHLTGKSLRQ